MTPNEPCLKLSRQELRHLIRYIDAYSKHKPSVFDIINTPDFAAYLRHWRAKSLLMPKTGSSVVPLGTHANTLVIMMNAVLENEIVLHRRKRNLFHHVYRLMRRLVEDSPLRIHVNYTTLQTCQDALRTSRGGVEHAQALRQLERTHVAFHGSRTRSRSKTDADIRQELMRLEQDRATARERYRDGEVDREQLRHRLNELAAMGNALRWVLGENDRFD